MAIADAFNRTSEYYDEWVRQALPCYDELFSTAVEVIPFSAEEKIRVLDLGAGTGLFSRHVVERYPHATFVLYDVAAQMLDVAKERFQRARSQFEFVVDDYMNLRDRDAFDLVISSLSIHHLPDEGKKELFRRLNQALRSGGSFINVDQIKGETEALRQLYWSTWLAKVRQTGAPEDRIQDSIQRRQAHDRDATLSDQLQWLQEAGFVDVDCVYKHYFMAVFSATKP